MKKYLLISILFFFAFTIHQPANAILPVNYNSLPDFPIFNTNSGKIYNYKLIEPNDSVQLHIDNSDSARIYTRLIVDDSKKHGYQYKLTINNSVEKIISKSAALSQVSKGLSGQGITSYNKYLCFFSETENALQFTNNSKYKILLKIKFGSPKNSSKHFEYISFPIAKFENKKVLKIENKNYEYYAANSKSIKFNLMGPFKLKLVSRIEIDKNDVSDKFRYRFDVYDNGSLLAEFTEVAYRSSESVFPNNNEQIPSTGDINILSFDKGMHTIEIKNPNVNREVIFSIYLNKLPN